MTFLLERRVRSFARRRQNRLNWLYCLLAAWLLTLGLAGAPALAQSFGKRTFASRSACEIGNFLTKEECKNAFDNAAAELDEKTPRFVSRAECERHFRRCMIAGYGAGGKGVEFEAAMRGVDIVVRSSTDKTVRPVLEQENPAISFDARTVLRQESGRSLSRRAQAQARWAEAQKPRPAPPNLAGVQKPGEYDPLTENLNFAAQPSKPPPPPDPAAEARRLERIRNAPYVPQ